MKALVVDDELNIQEILTILLEDFGFQVDRASNRKEADDLIDENYYDLALLDLRLPDGSGIDILKKLKEKNPKTEVVIVTAFASSETAVEAIKLGAYDYISKPFEINELRLLIRNVKNKLELEKKLAEKKDEKFEGLIGRSPAIQMVKETIEKVASYDINVLIVGESGTGKDIVARTIHRLSNRADRPFIAINCAAIPDTLLESELFGFLGGAFTDADKKGKYQSQAGITLPRIL